MQNRLSRNTPPQPMGNLEHQVEILVDRNVFSYMLDELQKHAQVEEGGKYIGYIFPPGDPAVERFKLKRRTTSIVVIDFLPGGPRAVRSAVEFMPDGEYQETMFRRIEQDDPHIEHLGSWHSHHCNGLQTLSKRDIRGYFRTVNKENYRPQFFLTSLVKRIPDKAKTLDWIDHFLFVREVDDYYLVTDKVQIIDWPSTCGVHTGHSIGNQTAIQEPVSSPEDEPALRQSDRIWYETEEGRRVLAEDKRFFDKQFSTNVTATRKDSQITITGGIGVLSISATYPYKTGERTILVLVKKGNSQILEILSDMSYRRVSLVAALAAIEDIQKSAFIQEE